MMEALGYVDELIRYLDSGKKVFCAIGKNADRSLVWDHPPKYVATALATSPKFTLPTLGQFYRPLEDLYSRENGKYDMYAEGYEIDMLRYPPFESFVLEFNGMSDKVFIKNKFDDMVVSKYILLCRQHPEGISIFPFLWNDREIAGIPVGWIVNGIHVIIRYQPETTRAPSFKGYGIRVASVENCEHEWTAAIASSMAPDIRALLQFLVVINVKNGVSRTESRTPRTMSPRIGRPLGYTYHVLDIDPEYVAPESQGTGSHGSPRYHLRRAHLRRLSEDKMTFVRQHFVGNPLLGIVDKDYRIKGENDGNPRSS
jgi:hypothetical protein